jgi:hypothetical protein
MRLHGCHNLPRDPKPLLVQDGWVEAGFHSRDTGKREKVRLPRMVEIPFVNSTECRHDKRTTDPGCEGCTHGKQ